MEPKKILLLSPDIERPVFNQNGQLKTERFLPPLGLGYLAAVLEKEAYLVKVVDATAKSSRYLRLLLSRFQPQVVGISCFTEHRGGSLVLARLAKKINPKTVVIFGGSHATFMYEQILSHYPEVDYCVLGEGEVTFPALLNQIFAPKKKLTQVLGIAFRQRGKVIKTPPRPWLENLNQLPFPNRDWIEPDFYRLPHKEVRDTRSAAIITARGCPFGCQFCSTSQFWGRRTRFRSLADIMAEIDWLWESGFRVLSFVADTFTLDQKRVQAICRKMLTRQYQFTWCCSTRAGMISKTTARLMRKAGCFSVNLGIESLSPTILKNVGKRITVAQARETFANLRQTGIQSGCLLMVGNPGESLMTIKETIANLAEVKPDSIFTNLTQVYPATPLYQLAKQKSFIDDDYWLDEKKASPVYLAENSLETLLGFEKMIWKGFFWQKGDYLRWFSRKSGLGSKVWPLVGKLKSLYR